MANDCLVKRLKGVANNSNLPIFNTYRITFPAGNYMDEFYGEIGFEAGTHVLITTNAVDPIYTNDTGVPREFPIDTVLLSGAKVGFKGVFSRETTIFVTPIYSINSIALSDTVKTDDINTVLKFSQSVESITGGGTHVCDITPACVKNPNIHLWLTDIGGMKLDINALPGVQSTADAVRVVCSDGCEVTGTTTKIANFWYNANRIQFWNCRGITGNVNAFAANPNFNTLILSYSDVTGTVESFVEAVATRTNHPDHYYIELGNTRVTFNNHVEGFDDFYITISGNEFILHRGQSASGDVAATYNKTTNTWTYQS